MNKINSFLTYHARRFGHYRFEEPVLVFESDDWGKVAGKEEGIYPPEFGTRTDWSFDRLETEDELDQLYTLLESFKDDFERKPVFTANFIISNPDFNRIREEGFQELHLKAIDDAFPHLHKKWLEGVSREVFYPQYHGRLHHNEERYLEALQNDEKTRFLFNQGINGGMENFKGTQMDLYSEYLDWENEVSIKGFDSWIRKGLTDFERIFGYSSVTTIAPNYVISPEAMVFLKNEKVKFLQAGNKITYLKDSKYFYNNYCLGHFTNEEIIFLVRNIKFEPSRNRTELDGEAALKKARAIIKAGLVAVIDTHRFNYVSSSAEKGLQHLNILLCGLRNISNLRILTSSELGAAIDNEGEYVDVFTGERKKLTPRDNALRKAARRVVS